MMDFDDEDDFNAGALVKTFFDGVQSSSLLLFACSKVIRAAN